MAYKNKEIEVKFFLKNTPEVIDFLNNNARKNNHEENQTDTYFTPAHKNFLEPEYPFQWLRIRESKKGISLNYKHFYPENQKETDYCDEFEAVISSPIVKNIFEKLDFKKLVEVKKNRNSWMYKDVEISIDQVEELGAFIELEITTHFDDPKVAKSYLYDIVKEICSGGLRRNDVDTYFNLLEKIGWSTKEMELYRQIKSETKDIKTGGYGVGLERLAGAIIGKNNIGEIQPYKRIPEEKIRF